MSTHRKIEWSCFVLGLIGTGASVWFEASLLQLVLLGVGTLFAGLHAFKLYDGRKANTIVMATSLALLVYLVAMAIISPAAILSSPAVLIGSASALLLALLSLRLRRDFVQH